MRRAPGLYSCATAPAPRTWRTIVAARPRERLAVAAVAVVALVLGALELHPAWHRVDAGYRVYSAYSDQDRLDAASEGAGFFGGVFTRLSENIERGDRVYFQVPRRPYGTLDLHDTIASLGRYYLLPAVAVTSPADATVIVSYDADPAALRLHLVSEAHFGPEFTFSRIAG